MNSRCNIIKIIAIVCFNLTLGVCFSQDYHKLGKEFILAKTSCPVQFHEDFKFEIESREKNLIILESEKPECFVIFLKCNKNPKVIAYSLLNRLSLKTKDNKLFEHSDFIKELSRIPVSHFSKKTSSNSNHIPVGPMLNTKWSQNRWYNMLCPYNINSNAGEHDMTGCIATAMGQIIRYYGKWNNFVIDREYLFNNQLMSSSSGEYDWGRMIDKPRNYDLEICKLLADLGILVEMNYGPISSSKGFGFARKYGFSNIGYDSAITDWRRQNENWLDDIYSNLASYHPVMIGGGGHAYVCDGYDDEGMLHFNMGWGGIEDGYYNPSCVSSYKFFSKEAIFNAYPSGYSDFPAPGCLRIQEHNNKPSVIWSPPEEDQKVLSYTVYYSDNQLITVCDTIIAIEDLFPGLHHIMISAVYSQGESIWIGPVEAFNRGSKLNDTDQAMKKAIVKSLDVHQYHEEQIDLYMGDLQRIVTLDVQYLCSDLKLLRYMPNIQELILDASGLDSLDLLNIRALPYLQNLEIFNYNGSLPNFYMLPKLVQLKFHSCSFMNLEFLEDYESLMVLELDNCSVGQDVNLEDLDDLVDLSISGTKTLNTQFINILSNLRILRLHNCDLAAIDLYQPLNKLICLDLSENHFKASGFLHYLPNLKKLCMSSNDFSTLPDLTKVPNLISLNVSKNRIIHLNGIDSFGSIQHLDLKSNLISDISPLLYGNLPSSLEFLELEYNPLSKESVDDVLPNLINTIETVHHPAVYEPRSPCYSEVCSSTINGNRNLHLSWYCESDDPELNFDLLINMGDGFEQISQGLINPFTEIKIDQENAFHWFVRANFSDTCFYSGLYMSHENGSVSLIESNIIGDNMVRVYPNPADNYIRINGLKLGDATACLRILNSSGQIVKLKELDHLNINAELSVSDLPYGIYFYQLVSNNSALESGKIIISH